ncbi:HNH endonuclease [Acinetobacter baumannii]
MRALAKITSFQTWDKYFQSLVQETGSLSMLKPNVNHKGYSRVTLKNGGECKTLSLHRVVAHAFIENHLGKTQVNHINGIKSDNDVANLEWCTPRENIHHALKTGLNKGVSSGEKKVSIN